MGLWLHSFVSYPRKAFWWDTAKCKVRYNYCRLVFSCSVWFGWHISVFGLFPVERAKLLQLEVKILPGSEALL